MHNWVQPLVERFISKLLQAARGSGTLEDWDRIGPDCPVLWSVKPVEHSNGKLLDKKWTFTTMPPIAELARFQLVSPDTSSVVGTGPMIIKSGGKIHCLAPPLTIRSTATVKGVMFIHYVEVTFSTVVIKNKAEGKIKIGTSEMHALDVSNDGADVHHWKLLPPYDDFMRYMKKTLPSRVKNLRDIVKKDINLPQVPDRVWDAVKEWRKKRSPRVAQRVHIMNPRLTRRDCGRIEPDHLRTLRELKEKTRREQQEAAEALRERKRQKRAAARANREGPARRGRWMLG